jgi:hypothetical protein
MCWHDTALKFEEDRATAYTARNLNILQMIFPTHTDVQWPARSPDLFACDSLLRGYLKCKAYANCPTTVTKLKENIREDTVALLVEMTHQITGNLCYRQ